jgi:hypothetical protein
LQTRQVVALVTVVVIIALALGTTIGYSISSGRTTTLMSTQIQTITSYGIPQGLVTVTKLVMISHIGDLTVVDCGTSTFMGGAVEIVDSTTTEYIFPPTNNGTSQGRFLNVTITTLTSSETAINAVSATNGTTITLTATSDNTTVCPVIP